MMTRHAAFRAILLMLISMPPCGEACPTMTHFNQDTNEISSGDSPYQINANCRWLIMPPSSNLIELHFSKFSLELGYDFIRVYNSTTTAPSGLIALLTGESTPPVVRSETGRMLVVFSSDSSQAREGFDGWCACLASTCVSIQAHTYALMRM
jgi:hypothetical protein